MMLLRPALFAALAACLALALPGPTRAEDAPRRVLVELFTSQGCSSCPPADELLHDLAEREDVVALSLHVDYWDYLGWRDTFAGPEMTKRQYAYRDSLGLRAVYTPQMVVQGARDAVGAHPDRVRDAIDAALAQRGGPGIRIARDGGMLEARLLPDAGGAPASVWFARYSREETVAIPRGENAGREITYRNVVRSLERIGTWAGSGSRTVMLPQPDHGEGVAVWVQEAPAGPVRAVAAYER